MKIKVLEAFNGKTRIVDAQQWDDGMLRFFLDGKVDHCRVFSCFWPRNYRIVRLSSGSKTALIKAIL